MISRVSIEQIQGVITVSKGNKAICMRLPPAILELMEAEAAAEGVSVPELCRRKIVEGSPPAGMKRATGQVAPIPTIPTSVYPAGSPSIVTPTPSPFLLSQRAVANIEAAATASVLAKVEAQFPHLSQPTEAKIHIRKELAELAKKRPEAIEQYIISEINKGKMSAQEIAELLEIFGIQ